MKCTSPLILLSKRLISFASKRNRHKNILILKKNLDFHSKLYKNIGLAFIIDLITN